MRIDETCAELDELRFHSVVHTGRITLVVGACPLKSSLLLEVVKRDIIGVVCTATAEVYIVILPDSCLKHLVKPIGIGVIHKLITPRFRVQLIASGNRSTRVCTCLTYILAVLVGIHHIVNTTRNLVNSHVTRVINFQRLVFLTVLCRDDNHAVGSSRAIDCAGCSIFQHLNGGYIIRRKIANGRTNGHTIDHI